MIMMTTTRSTRPNHNTDTTIQDYDSKSIEDFPSSRKSCAVAAQKGRRLLAGHVKKTSSDFLASLTFVVCFLFLSAPSSFTTQNSVAGRGGSTGILMVDAQASDPYGDYNDYGPADDEYYGGDMGGDYYGQDGGGYDNNDSLYRDYAARQQEKMMGVDGGVPNGGGPGWMKLFCTGAVGWWAGGKYHTSRVLRKSKRKFQREQKQLYSQYYNDVYKLTEQVQELTYLVEQYQDALKQTEAQHELEALQRDYDEFKQPDVDGDDRISRAEFNMYVKNYLSHYPGLTEADYPKFEDFDHDNDGYVSFKEYAQQMALQAQQAEKDALKSGNTGKSSQKAKAMNDLYGSTAGGSQKKNESPKQTGSFEDIYKQYL